MKTLNLFGNNFCQTSQTKKNFLLFVLFLTLSLASYERSFSDPYVPPCVTECSGTWTPKIENVIIGPSCTFSITYYKAECDPCQIFVNGAYLDGTGLGCFPRPSTPQLINMALVKLLQNPLNVCEVPCPGSKTGVSVHFGGCWKQCTCATHGYGIEPCQPIVSCCTRTYTITRDANCNITLSGGSPVFFGEDCDTACTNVCYDDQGMINSVDLDNENLAYFIYNGFASPDFGVSTLKFNKPLPEDTFFEVVDISGNKVIVTEVGNSAEFSIDNYITSGLYFYKLTNKSQIIGKGKFYVKK